MYTAICDDERIMYHELKHLLERYEYTRHTEIFTEYFSNGRDLLLSHHKFDIIFMDYQMKGLNGIETCRRLREKNSNCIIIFISAYPEAALDSFEVGTFRFLKKPVDINKLFKALDDYLKTIYIDDLLIINTHEHTWKLKSSDVIYAEAVRHKTRIHTVSETIEISDILKSVEKMLPPDKFVRCHRSYIANLSHVNNHTQKKIFFDNGEAVEIGPSFLKIFSKKFRDYIAKYNRGEL